MMRKIVQNKSRSDVNREYAVDKGPAELKLQIDDDDLKELNFM